MSGTRLALALLLAVTAGCIMKMGTTKTPINPEERIPVPDKYKADKPPELVSCQPEVDACQCAPSLDPNLYFCAKDGHWFRYAQNRWYLAFAWDGNWFPTVKTDLPPSLVAITPAPEEVKKSRAARLKELDKKLEEIDGEKSSDEKLKEEERKLEELDKQEKQQQAPQSAN
ncbi:MAG TPA: hypothetical protein VMR50_11070 [Myxococcota bacterium]|nr:hypothetical protein [Myxococcota bacterium]